MAKENIVDLIVNFSNNASKELENVADSAKDSTKEIGLLSKTLGALNKSSLIGWAKTIGDVFSTMVSASKAQAEYIESLNLLKVSFGKTADAAETLIDKISAGYGTDPFELSQSLAIYRQMTSAMNFTSDAADILSTNLIKLQEDASSLYNLDFEVIGKKFQSALAGQTRAVRSLGVDITQASLQQELYNLGLNKNITDLNRASKTALIYLTLERQMTNAHGDAARTINSVANQTRIFKEQIAVAGRQLGAVFIPVLRAVLPLVNGLIMALNVLGKTILSFFGIDARKMASEFGIATAGISTGIDDIGAGIDDIDSGTGSALKKAKELNKQLRSFDKLNVITTPTDTGSSGGGSGGGAGGGGLGVDPDILKYLDEYDLALEKFGNKATEIRDIILEWAKNLEPLKKPLIDLANLTFENLAYVWENVLKPMGKWAANTLIPQVVKTLASGLELVYKVGKKMQPVFKALIDYVVVPFGRNLGGTIVNLLKLIEAAFNALSRNKLFTTLTGFVASLKLTITLGQTLYKWFGNTKIGKVFSAWNSTLIESVKETKSLSKGWSNFIDTTLATDKKLNVPLSKVNGNLKDISLNLQGAKLAAMGLAEGAVGLSLFSTSIGDLSSNGFNLVSMLTSLSGGFMAIKGGAEIATGVIGLFSTSLAAMPIVGIVGAIIGAGGLVASLIATKNAAKEAELSMYQLSDSQKESMMTFEAQMQHTQDLANELGGLMDANGKVTDSEKERAEYILGELNKALGTEYSLSGNQIMQNGKVVKSYNDIKQSIKDYIATLKGKYALEQFEEQYNNALKTQYEAQKQLNALEDTYNSKLKELKQQRKNNVITEDEYKKARELVNKTYDDEKNKVNKTYNEAGKVIQNYSKLSYAVSTGNINDMNKYYNKMMDTTTKSSEKYTNSYAVSFDTAIKKVTTKVKGYTKDALQADAQAKQNAYNQGNAIGTQFGKGYTNGLASQINNRQIKVNSSGNISLKAEGGFLNTGELFVAREAGPEMVGKIGNRNAVVNNKQIVDSISLGVAKAMASSGGKGTNVIIQAEGDTEGFMNFIKFKQKEQSRQYGF